MKIFAFNPYSAMNNVKSDHFIFLMWIYNYTFFSWILRKKIAIAGFEGVGPDYYNITEGGSSKFITILQGGSLGTPTQICITYYMDGP